MKGVKLLLVAFVWALLNEGNATENNLAGFVQDTYSNCLIPRTTARCPTGEEARYRTVDGTCNNLDHVTWGATNTILTRVQPANYSDPASLDTPKGFPGTLSEVSPANQVSQALFETTTTNDGNQQQISTLLMTFGQFLDHDVTFVPHASCQLTKDCQFRSSWVYPCFPIRFHCGGHRCTPFGRSNPVCKPKNSTKPRQQLNSLSAFVDGSQIYSNEKVVFEELKKTDGSGELKITDKETLPVAVEYLTGKCKTKGGCSLVGDNRADENSALHSMHTLWVREHNRIARALKAINPKWSGRKTFDETRKLIVALWQHITYNEYLPFITRIPPYTGYSPSVNPSISNAFATAAFRYGHSLIPNSFARLNNNFDEADPPISLQESFFNRRHINEKGIEPLMFGLVGNQSDSVDMKFADGIFKKLFIEPGKVGHLDLTALNIQRGRDHGLATYGAYRRFCKLPEIKTWEELDAVMLPGVGKAFRLMYENPNDIDLFAAGIAEQHHAYRGAHARTEYLTVGPTFACLLTYQFKALRDGDRFFYRSEGVFSTSQLRAIERVTMSTILCTNLKGIVSMQRNAFYVGSPKNRRVSCAEIPALDLKSWKEEDSKTVKQVEEQEKRLAVEDEELDSILTGLAKDEKDTHGSSRKRLASAFKDFDDDLPSWKKRDLRVHNEKRRVLTLTVGDRLIEKEVMMKDTKPKKTFDAKISEKQYGIKF